MKFIILLLLISISISSQELIIKSKKTFKNWGYVLSKNIPNYSEKYIDSIIQEYDILAINGIEINGKGQIRFAIPFMHKINLTKLSTKDSIKKIYPMIVFSSIRDGIEFLNSVKSKQKFTEEIILFLKSNSMLGIHLDIEYLPIEYSEKLSNFLFILKEELNQNNYKLTISFFPQIDFPEKLSKLHDPEKLKNSVDEIVLMSYDLHNQKTEAGCTTSYQWTQKNIEHLLKSFKAEQIWLGIPAYGYEWSMKNKKVSVVSSFDGVQFSKSKKIEREKSGCLKYINPNKSIGYFSDSETRENLKSIAKDFSLIGTALWRVGFEETKE